MFDVFHYIGGDVASSVTGDLLPVDGTIKGQQRILRRLLTNPGDYIWHPTYGAGLGAKVGDNTDIPAITALIRAQIRLESVVSQNPPPTVRVTAIQSGVSVYIGYTDAISKTPQTLSFDINR